MPPQAPVKKNKTTKVDKTLNIESYLALVPGMTEGQKSHFLRSYKLQEIKTISEWRDLTKLKDIQA